MLPGSIRDLLITTLRIILVFLISDSFHLNLIMFLIYLFNLFNIRSLLPLENGLLACPTFCRVYYWSDEFIFRGYLLSRLSSSIRASRNAFALGRLARTMEMLIIWDVLCALVLRASKLQHMDLNYSNKKYIFYGTSERHGTAKEIMHTTT